MKNKDALKYKGYTGSIEYSKEDKIFYGKVLNIDSLLLYEGETLELLEQDFRLFVDDHIKFCEDNGFDYEKPYKGNTNVRLEPDLYSEIKKRSEKLDISINKYINMALTAFVYNESAYTKK